MTRKSRPSTLIALCAAAFLAVGAAAQEDKPYRPEGASAPKAVKVQPGSKDKGEPAIDSPIGCSLLYVVVQNNSSDPAALVKSVTCNHGYFLGTVPSSNETTAGEPAVLSFFQSAGWGPDCTITLSGLSSTWVLAVQQNYCAFKSGSVTASVVSGSATMNGTSQGSFSGGLPGVVWFTLN